MSIEYFLGSAKMAWSLLTGGGMLKWLSAFVGGVLIFVGLWLFKNQKDFSMGLVGQFAVAQLIWISLLLAVGDLKRLYDLFKKDQKSSSDIEHFKGLQLKILFSMVASFFTVFFLKDNPFSALYFSAAFIFSLCVGSCFVSKKWRLIIACLDLPEDLAEKYPATYKTLAVVMISFLLALGMSSFFSYLIV